MVSNFDIDIFAVISCVFSVDSKLGAAHHQQMSVYDIFKMENQLLD